MRCKKYVYFLCGISFLLFLSACGAAARDIVVEPVYDWVPFSQEQTGPGLLEVQPPATPAEVTISEIGFGNVRRIQSSSLFVIENLMDVEMYVSGKNDDSVNVRIYNGSRGSISVTLPAIMEVYEDGSWWENQFRLYGSIRFNIQPGRSYRFTEHRLHRFDLEPGRYRLRIPISAGGHSLRHDVTAEFDWDGIEESE